MLEMLKRLCFTCYFSEDYEMNTICITEHCSR